MSAPDRISLPDLPDLVAEARALWKQIPVGQVATFGDIAEALGSKTASRWLGTLARSHEHHDDDCSCHRLVRADGSLGGYVSDNLQEKAERLASEQVVIDQGHVDLTQYRFRAFESHCPLGVLAEFQRSLEPHVRLLPKSAEFVAFEELGGVDVSYRPPNVSVAAYTVTDFRTGDLIWSHTTERVTDFPYVSGFLAFRELPVLIQLIQEVRECNKLAEVTMVDGSGILHPRGMGLATMLGVIADLATIGVTKKSLCGRTDGELESGGPPRMVLVDDEPQGAAMLPATGSQRPLYFSPGQRMNVAIAAEVGRQQCQRFRLPMPIYWADKISRKIANSVD